MAMSEAKGRADAPARAEGAPPRPDAPLPPPRRKPGWLIVRLPPARPYRATAALLQKLHLHTVCDEARCPNKGECFASGTATFLILGDECSRACGFCAVRHGSPNGAVDADEPRRVAEAARLLGLRHVVVTSVTRDDLPDGGATHYAATIRAVREAVAGAAVEVLVPDFGGDQGALATVLAERPDVLDHNLETVPRLYAEVRPQGGYARSLALLRRASAWARWPGAADARRRPETDAQRVGNGVAWRPRPLVKTGLMVGLHEAAGEVEAVLTDCATAGVDLVTIGQYLQPARGCRPVSRYVPPKEFDELERAGAALGLRVIAAPFVRSSYRAAETLTGWRR